MLANLRKKVLATKGTISLAGIQSHVHEKLHITGLDALLPEEQVACAAAQDSPAKYRMWDSLT